MEGNEWRRTRLRRLSLRITGQNSLSCRREKWSLRALRCHSASTPRSNLGSYLKSVRAGNLWSALAMLALLLSQARLRTARERSHASPGQRRSTASALHMLEAQILDISCNLYWKRSLLRRLLLLAMTYAANFVQGLCLTVLRLLSVTAWRPLLTISTVVQRSRIPRVRPLLPSRQGCSSSFPPSAFSLLVKELTRTTSPSRVPTFKSALNFTQEFTI